MQNNFPFVLETNLLLTEYLQFKKYEDKDVNFKMTGNYINKDTEINEKGKIYRMNENEIKKSGKFINEYTIETPRNKLRFFPTVGVIVFNEGITLSYAERIDKTKEIELFKPIAYLSDKEHKRSFILYYDPKINDEKENKISRGPIIVHGGLTSAFYEFKLEGTGKIIKSIALWLARIEERFFDEEKLKIPHIIGKKIGEKKFDQWNNDQILTYTILILDVSGSMTNYYLDLINMTNQIIKLQKEKKEPNENEGVIILFGDNANEIRKGKFINIKDLELNDIYNANVGGGTNFYNAFNKAQKYLNIDEKFTSRKVLFLTDGQDTSDITDLCKNIKECGFKISFFGLGNTYKFNNLEKFKPNYLLISNNFEKIKHYIIKNSTI